MLIKSQIFLWTGIEKSVEIEILLERDYNKNYLNQIPRGSVTQRVYLKAILWQKYYEK